MGRRFGRAAWQAFIADLTAGRFLVPALERVDYLAIRELETRYADTDLDLGLSDCALVVLAERFGTARILSYDHRHFRAVRPLAGADAFTILPADGPATASQPRGARDA